jgi:hypothetical protein
MIYQKSAEGIMLTHDFKDSKFYDVQCTCGNEDDSIEVQVEVDEYEEIMIHFYTTGKTKWWKTLVDWQTYKIDNPILYFIVNSTQSLINGIHQRIKITWDVWINGYVEYQTTTILNKQRALNFSQTLLDAILTLEEQEKVNVKN